MSKKILHTKDYTEILEQTPYSDEHKSRITEIMGNIQTYYDELNSISKEYQNTELDKTIQDFDVEEFLEKLNLLPRMISYFVLTLFAYLEIYSKSLYQYAISKISVDQIYDFTRVVKVHNNPKTLTQSILDFFKTEEGIGLFAGLKTLKDDKFNVFFDTLEEFIKIRNQLAHRKPLTSILELKNKFPELDERAKIIYDKEVKRLTEEDKEFLASLLEDFSKFGFISEISKSCFTYIMIIDNFVELINQETS